MQSSSSQAYKTRRRILGIFVLLVVDVLWVGSSELTRLIFQKEDFRRPFFTTYFKTSMFVMYLTGFLFHKPWRDRCLNPPERDHQPPSSSDSSAAEVGAATDPSAGEHPVDPFPRPRLSDPEYEPTRYSSDIESDRSSIASDTEDLLHSLNQQQEEPLLPIEEKEEGGRLSPPAVSSRSNKKHRRLVKFNKLHEVRRMPEAEAELASLSRLSFAHERVYAHAKLPIRRVAQLAMQFCLLWFLGNYAYQAALNNTDPGVVNVLSSTSSLFTLIIAAVYPSSAVDRFSLSKFCSVALSIGGVVLITWVDQGTLEPGIPRGAIWALVGAFCYAAYLVMFKRRVVSEDRIDISMFLGFVGLFNLAILWPGFYVLNATNAEEFYPLPNRTQLLYVTINGLVGTVLSDYLWLWGCFLTSSLIATLSLSLTVPMTIAADAILWKERYPWEFFAGSVPVILAFVFATVLTHYENWDPVYGCLKRVLRKLFMCVLWPSPCCRKWFLGGKKKSLASGAANLRGKLLSLGGGKRYSASGGRRQDSSDSDEVESLILSEEAVAIN